MTDEVLRDLDLLHPLMRQKARNIAAALKCNRWFDEKNGWRRFEVFETYRSPARQHMLLTERKTTKAGPWKSAHQYGLAFDVAVVDCLSDGTTIAGTWAWPDEADWLLVDRIAENQGLDVPIPWDLGHIEHPAWQEIRRAFRQ